MPVERKYRSNAERQAAYRARHPEQRPPTDAELAILARSLHVLLVDAAEAGRSPWPEGLVGDRADQTLRNLIRYLDPPPDPLRAPSERIHEPRGTPPFPGKGVIARKSTA